MRLMLAFVGEKWILYCECYLKINSLFLFSVFFFYFKGMSINILFTLAICVERALFTIEIEIY